jgi:uncharacterized FAD-dependent dehydrogenase
MAIRIFPVPLFLNEDETILPQRVADILGLPLHHVQRWRIIKKSLDARQKKKIHFVYALEISLPPAEEARVLDQPPKKLKVAKVVPAAPALSKRITQSLKERPIIVGSGPAALFCAWQLVAAGLTPLIIERGKMVEERIQDVARFGQKVSSIRKAMSNSEKEVQELSLMVNCIPASIRPWLRKF